jgi:hypothetical protein
MPVLIGKGKDQVQGKIERAASQLQLGIDQRLLSRLNYLSLQVIF